MSTLKRVLTGGLVVLAALTMIAGMAMMVAYRFDSSSYTYSLVKHGMTGFDFMGFDRNGVIFGSNFEWAVVLGGIICWLAFLAAIAVLVLGIVSMINKSAGFHKTVLIVGTVLLGVFSFLYMLLGVITSVINITSYNYEVLTEAYIPFMLIVNFMVPALILFKVLPDGGKKERIEGSSVAGECDVIYAEDDYTAATPSVQSAPKNTVVEQRNKIEVLKQYKELLDMGVISQEEFDAKKAELL